MPVLQLEKLMMVSWRRVAAGPHCQSRKALIRWERRVKRPWTLKLRVLLPVMKKMLQQEIKSKCVHALCACRRGRHHGVALGCTVVIPAHIHSGCYEVVTVLHCSHIRVSVECEVAWVVCAGRAFMAGLSGSFTNAQALSPQPSRGCCDV